MAIDERFPRQKGQATGPGKTKGMGWVEQIRCYQSLHGRDKLIAAVRKMPDKWRQGIDETHPSLGVLDATWYFEEQRNAFFDAIVADLTLLQQQTLARAMSKAVMERSVRGLHRMIFTIMATPERFVKHAQSLWDVHHDTGQLRMTQLSPTSIEAAVLDWPTHHPFGCMLNHYSCMVTLEAMGCFDMSERRVCLSTTHTSECVGVYYWRKR
jgi:hypothetical protein